MKQTPLIFCASMVSTSFGVLLGLSDAQAAVNISNKPTKNMSCSAGVCSPTAKGAVLNATDLANMLQASDMKVTTGSGAITIEITSALSWASSNHLTLDANCNVSIKAPVAVAGPGGLSVITNDGGSGCDLLFFSGGKVDFWDLSSSLVVNGNAFTLVDDIRTLSADIAANPSGSYALSSDYDAGPDGTYRQSPIATDFKGKFEGLGHAISRLAISSRTKSIGLFAVLRSKGEIIDLRIVHSHITALDSARSPLSVQSWL